jgi:flagellar biosynthesis protein FlhF
LKIRKFVAGSSREALRLVREALGPDAVVLSNRATEDGVELVALAEDDLASLAHPGESATPRASVPQASRPEPWTPYATPQAGSNGSSAASHSSSHVDPTHGGAHDAPMRHATLPDPFASRFGAPAAVVDQGMYGSSASHNGRNGESSASSQRVGAGDTAHSAHSATQGAMTGHGALPGTSQGATQGALQSATQGAPLTSATLGVPPSAALERALERLRQQPASSDTAVLKAGAGTGLTPGLATRVSPPYLGDADHVVHVDSKPMTPADAMAKHLGGPVERHAARPTDTDAARAWRPEVTSQPIKPLENHGMPLSAAAFAVAPVRFSMPEAQSAAEPTSQQMPTQPALAYSVHTNVSASFGMPFNLGATSTQTPTGAADSEATVASTAVATDISAADSSAADISATAAALQQAIAAAPIAAAPVTPKPDLAAEIAAVPVDEAQMRVAEIVAQSVIGEIQSMRGVLEEKLAGLLWSNRQQREPVRGQAAKTLLAAGFSAQLVKLMIDRMPSQTDHAQAMQWLKATIERNLPVLQSEDALLERGGVYALMGPTGVGKTTTTAKLAARCVIRYGADRVALLTTDSYRIGAREQLHIYGKILGVSVHAVKDAVDLRLVLSELRNKHIVLIDTIGMSQRDRAVSEQIAMLCGTGVPVQRLLLLNATSHGDTLNEVVHAYRNRQAESDPELAGCILTKLDEATNIGAALDTVIRYRLPIHYVSTGQKVPENFYVGRKDFLMKAAFNVSREQSPFVSSEDDLHTIMAAASSNASAELSAVRFG